MAFLLLLSAAVLCVAYPMVWTDPPVTTADAPGYLEVAQDLAHHGYLTQLHFRAPVYPALLVLTGSEHSLSRSLLFVMLVLHFSTIAMLLSILHRQGLPRWALVFTCMICLTPPFVEPAILYHTEVPTAFFLVASLWMITSGFRPWLSGGIAGIAVALSALTRPTFQLLALPLFLLLAFNRQTVKAISLLLTSSLIIGGFALFNFWGFGYFGITPALGWNLTNKTAKFVERNPDSRTREILLKARNSALVTGNSHNAINYVWGVDKTELANATGLYGVELDKYMLRLNLQLIRSTPLGYLNEVGTSFVEYWLPVTGSFSNADSRAMQMLWSLLQLSLVMVFMVTFVAVIGTSLTHTWQRPLDGQILVYLIGLLYIFYSMIVTCTVDLGIPRYRLPLEGILVGTTAIGLCLWRQLRSPKRSEMPPT